MEAKLHLAVIGYGTAGQAAAVLLARDGHRVEVFERVPEPGPVGAGLLLQPTGLQVLWRMQLLIPALVHGAPIRRLYGEAAAGCAVMDMCYAGLDRRLFGLGMQRGALFSLLANALPDEVQLHRGTGVVRVDHTLGLVHDEHGRIHGTFDLVVAADGSASQLRQQVEATRLDRVYPWGALWCLVPLGDWVWNDELRQRYVAARRMVGLLPVGTRPGNNQPMLSFFWSLPMTEFERWQQRGVPAWLEDVGALWPEAASRMHGITACGQLAQASYRDTTMKRWYRDRLVLMGDAAHSMSPQLGQGVNMALMDALALRDALRMPGNLDSALAHYQAQRQRHVSLYQFLSRWLTPLFQSNLDLVAKVRDVSFLPMGRLPGSRGHMLRVLSGTQQGYMGKLQLDPGFMAALADNP